MNTVQVKKFLKSWVLPLAIEALVLFLLLKFVFFFAYVPTGSMIPTIDEGSWIFSTHLHNTENIQRGEILIFHSEEENQTLVKRVVGLPGEHVEILQDGTVTIDGQPLDEPYVQNQYAIPGSYDVPEGHYLFFGDNRASSKDARYWNNPYIPAEDIIGRARFTIWPLHNFGFLS